MKPTILILTLGVAVFFAGCGPSKAEREAEQRARMEQEDRDRKAAEIANQAITDMNQKMFRKLTPEERAQRDEERKRNAQKLVDEMKARETQP